MRKIELLSYHVLLTDLHRMVGDRVLERILFPIVKYSMTIKREKPSEGGTPENELQHSIAAPKRV